MLGVGNAWWVVRAGSEDPVFIAWINTALRFTVCTFLLHFGTILETVCPFILISQEFVLHWIFQICDFSWQLGHQTNPALNCSPFCSSWAVSGFPGVTLWPFSMQGDSVESPKSSGPWIPAHSWRFTVDQDPVSSKQGASAGQEQLRGSHAASLQAQTLEILCVCGSWDPSVTGHRSCIL